MSLAQSLEELVAHAQLGHYTIIEHLAEGGMGHVYRAFEPSLSREVAIKVLKAELADDPDKINAFDLEAQNIAALRHTNIVPIYFVGHQGDLHYFVMPFITGSTLDEWVENAASMNADQSMLVLTQAVEALDWAYKNGIIHLDIKPSNFLVDNSGVILLTDFGLSKTMGQVISEESDECYGTPAYMCPEQILQQNTDQRSDIYSLGATLYHLMTNHFLYDCDTISELVQAHLEAPFPYEKAAELGLAPGWINLFDRMTQKKPADRFQTYDELRSALAKVDRLGPVKNSSSKKTINPDSVIVPLRRSVTKEYANGLLHSSFNSWAETAIDPNLKKPRATTLSSLQKPLKPLMLPRLVKSIKEMNKMSAVRAEDLVEALALMPQVENYVNALAYTGFARHQANQELTPLKSVRYVGTDLVSQLVLTSLMWRDDFSSPKEFIWDDFWQHSVSVGVVTHYLIHTVAGNFIPKQGWTDPTATKNMAMLAFDSFLKSKDKTNYYLAGLIHDIGKLAMAEIGSYPYYAALRSSIEEQTNLLEQEEKFMGVGHTELGGLWLEWNGIEGYLKQAVTNHHDLTSKLPPVVAAVGIANQLVKIYGLGYSGSPIIDVRNVWETRAWNELKKSFKNESLTAAQMEETFIPLISELPLLERLEK